MLITNNLKLYRILRITWKVDILMIIACAAIYYVRVYIFPETIQIPPTLVTLLGTALAFFIGFNNNQAYNRWWEARIIWGALVNDSRTWARNILHYTVQGNLSAQELGATKRKMILRHLGFVYALNSSLRRNNNQYFKKFLNEEEHQHVNLELNIPNAVLTLNARDLQKLSLNKCIDEFRFMQLNQLLTAFTDHMGKSERIRNTIFPPAYVYFTKLFIWVLVIFSTIILTDLIGVWSILVSWVVGFIFHVTHLNGMNLMDPFDEIPSGTPLNQISRTIEINLLQMLGDSEIPEPAKPINNEYHL